MYSYWFFVLSYSYWGEDAKISNYDNRYVYFLFSFIMFTFCILKLFNYKLIHLCNFWLICLHKELAIILLWNIPLHCLYYFLPCSLLSLSDSNTTTMASFLFIDCMSYFFHSLFPNYLCLKKFKLIEFLQFSLVVCVFFFLWGAVVLLTLSDNLF